MAFKNFTAKVIYKQELIPNIFLLKTEPSELVEFFSGQYFSFRIADKINRSYSVASAPGEPTLDFVIDISPGGPGSIFAKDVQIGESFNAMGPFGFFNLVNSKAFEDEEPLIFVGVGTGIVPMRSMVLDLLTNKNSKREIRLYFGLRYDNLTYYFEEFSKLAEEYPNFKFIPVISRPTENWKGECGHCQNILMKLPVIKNAKIYVCGRTEVVKSISDELIEFGYPKESVFFEKFG